MKNEEGRTMWGTVGEGHEEVKRHSMGVRMPLELYRHGGDGHGR